MHNFQAFHIVAGELYSSKQLRFDLWDIPKEYQQRIENYRKVENEANHTVLIGKNQRVQHQTASDDFVNTSCKCRPDPRYLLKTRIKVIYIP